MRHFIFLTFLLQFILFNTYSIHAATKKTGFKIEYAAGIILYDEPSIIKMLSLKKKEELKKQLTELLSNYNKDLENLKLANKRDLDEAAELVKKHDYAAQKGDMKTLKELSNEIIELIQPIKQASIKRNNKLQMDLKKILPEKEYKRLMRYDERKRRSLLPSQLPDEGPGSGFFGGTGIVDQPNM